MDKRRDRQHKWRSRLAGLLALLFAFYVNYIPVHLAAEMHLDDALPSVAHGLLHHDGHDDGDHESDSDHHMPHPASDHTLTLTVSTTAPSPSAYAIVLLPAIASILLYEPEPQPPIPVFERSRPPGESPPDPAQPRAPPIA